MKTETVNKFLPFYIPKGKDLYELSTLWGCTLQEALLRVTMEGWIPETYNDCGELTYLEPQDD